MQLTSDKASPKIWLSLADIYQHSNRQDKADSLYASLALYPDITIRANAYKNLLSGLLQQSSSRLHSLFEQYTTAADSVYGQMYDAELNELQYKYETVSLEKENVRLYNRWLLSASAFMVLFIAVGITFPRFYRKRQKKLYDLQHSLSVLENDKKRLLAEQSIASEYRCTLQEKEMKLKSLDETIKEHQNKIRRLKDNVKKMDAIKERFQVSHTDNDDESQKVYRTLMEHGMYHPSTNRIHLAAFLNSLFYGFADRLSNQYPLLKERDLDICYMLALQLTADEMAKILDISTDSVKRYIRKINKEMQAASCDTMSLEDRINHLKRRM